MLPVYCVICQFISQYQIILLCEQQWPGVRNLPAVSTKWLALAKSGTDINASATLMPWYYAAVSTWCHPLLNISLVYNSTIYHLKQGHRSWGFGGLNLLKNIGGVRVCFDPLKMSHSFIQNCCSITLRVLHHQGWKTCVKVECRPKTNFLRCLQAVNNQDYWVFGNHWRRV